MLLSLLAMFALVFYFAKDKSLNPNSSYLHPTLVPTLSEKQALAATYSIEGMRKRSYPQGEIKKEKLLYETSTFSAYLTSYSSDGLKLYALVSFPKSQKPVNGFPVLIVNHGYIDPTTYSTQHSYKNTFDYFATKGFIVIKPDYRGFGQSEGDKNNPLNRLAYAIDVLTIINSLSTLPESNPNKLVLWGHSLGGDVTLRVLEITSLVKGASLWGPVSADYPESSLYFIRKNRPEELKKIEELIYRTFSPRELAQYSPSQNLDFITSPLIIHHGTADESVPYEWSLRLEKKLKQENKDHEFYSYLNEDHNFTRGSRALVLQRDIDFFNKLLNN